MLVTERDLLEEIERIVHPSNMGKSLSKGKHFYNDPMRLPKLFDNYIHQSRKITKRAAAKMFDVSPATITRIIEGYPLSENILFRLRRTLEYAWANPGISVQHDEPDTYAGDWRRATTADVQKAISIVAERLIYLKRVVESNNVLKSEHSPIDKIHMAQLIAMLESVLASLKAPYIDKNQTKGFFSWIRKLGRKGVEKGMEKQISDAIDDVVSAGGDLLSKLADANGTSDLGNMIT